MIDSIHFPNSLVYVDPTEEGVCEQVFIRVLLSLTFIPTHIKSEKKPVHHINSTSHERQRMGLEEKSPETVIIRMIYLYASPNLKQRIEIDCNIMLF